jgi:hypothetical protein
MAHPIMINILGPFEALGAQGGGEGAEETSAAFAPEKFFEIAQQFHGKRFAGPVKADHRALCSTLQRAM